MTKSKVEYLTKEKIIERLKIRLGDRLFTLFHEEVQRETGMGISYSHLFNIVRGDREPNDVVMKYLGGQRIEGETVYQIAAGRKVKRR